MAGLFVGCGGDDTTGPGVVNPPSSVTAQASTATSADVTFTPVIGATSYVVERAPGASGGTFEEVGTPSTSPFTDPGLEPNTTYRYRVATVSGSTTSAFSSEAQVTTLAPGRQVVNVTADITTNTTWVVDNVYRLQGFRKVTSGATLTIQPGTRIEGDFNTIGSSLFVLRGARIQAIGTAANPIVFTSSQTAGTRQPGDWGGLIIVGNGAINRADPTTLEGTGTNADNPLINYAGGNNNADNSGELRYVRVEFAGFAPAENAELNSFTFAAVGSGTALNYLQSLAGLDDSFEWFGGAADGKYFVSYESGDDHFDMSEGYSGRLQYLVALQTRILQTRPEAGGVSSD
ncbi:MAG: fibronectin type III domain-containing protein, partial [Gammaproteobacteria bacterium]